MKRGELVIGAGALAAFAVGLAGCNQRAAAANGDLHLGDSKYCSPFKTASAPGALGASLADPAGAFDDCIHRWGYALAPARDPADVVAQATVNACGPILSTWTQQMMAQGGESAGLSRQSDRRQPDPVAQQVRMAESKALFYVVQARAGQCAPPPANTLFASNPPTG